MITSHSNITWACNRDRDDSRVDTFLPVNRVYPNTAYSFSLRFWQKTTKKTKKSKNPKILFISRFKLNFESHISNMLSYFWFPLMYWTKTEAGSQVHRGGWKRYRYKEFCLSICHHYFGQQKDKATINNSGSANKHRQEFVSVTECLGIEWDAQKCETLIAVWHCIQLAYWQQRSSSLSHHLQYHPL